MPNHHDIEQAVTRDLTTDRDFGLRTEDTHVSPPIPNHNPTIPPGVELHDIQHAARMGGSPRCQNMVMPDLLDVMPAVEHVTEENGPVIRDDEAQNDERLR